MECITLAEQQKREGVTCIADHSHVNHRSNGEAHWGNDDVNATVFAALALAAVCMLLSFCGSLCDSSWSSKRDLRIKKSFPVGFIKGKPTCVICLLDIDHCGRKLQCGHCFHAECIMTWWTLVPRIVVTCPTCRRPQTILESSNGIEVSDIEVPIQPQTIQESSNGVEVSDNDVPIQHRVMAWITQLLN